MKTYFAHHIGPAVALVLCAVAAWAVTLLKWKPPAHEVAPFAFLAIVLVTLSFLLLPSRGDYGNDRSKRNP